MQHGHGTKAEFTWAWMQKLIQHLHVFWRCSVRLSDASRGPAGKVRKVYRPATIGAYMMLQRNFWAMQFNTK